MKKTIGYPQCTAFMIVAILQFMLPAESTADFFKYRDDSGSLIVINRLEDVPKKYRKRVKVVWDSELEARDSVARRRNDAREEHERQAAAKKVQEEKEVKNGSARREKTLVIEFDENSGQVIRRFE